jgi:hypothetical protein
MCQVRDRRVELPYASWHVNGRRTGGLLASRLP